MFIFEKCLETVVASPPHPHQRLRLCTPLGASGTQTSPRMLRILSCAISLLLALPALAADPPPFTPTPWPSKTLTKAAPDWKTICPTCTIEKTYPTQDPFLEVLLLGDRSYQEFPTPPELVFYRLAFRTKSGWFVLQEFTTDGPRCGGDAPFWTSFSNDKPTYIPRLPSEPPLFTITFDTQVQSSGRGPDPSDRVHKQIDDHSVIACGVTPDHAVACTFPSILTRNTGSYASSWTQTHRWLEDGSLELSADTSKRLLSFALPLP